jgi:hypothetical protein
MKNGIQDTVGKRISGIVVAENTQAPRRQVFLIFDDNTYFEFYGNEFSGASGIDPGNAANAAAYATKAKGAKIEAVYPKSLLEDLERLRL